MTDRVPFQRIAVTAARTLIAERAPLIFDVRAREAFDESHIAGARHLTIQTLSLGPGSVPAGKPILIYCYHGFASQEWAQIFSDFRYPEVYSLDGGYEAWRQAEQAAEPGQAGGPLKAWLAREQFISLDSVIANRTTPLMRACLLGDMAMAREIIGKDADINARNADGNNALWLACAGNHLGTMALLAEAGIDIDNRNDNGATVLMYAASSGKDWAVEYLLAAGANTALESLDGFTALDMASTAECLALLRKPARERTPA